MAGQSKPSRKEESSLKALYGATFLNMLSSMLIIQSTPLIVGQSIGDPKLTLAKMSQLVSGAAAGEIILNPIVSDLSEKYGRKLVLMAMPTLTVLCRAMVVRNPKSFKAIAASRVLGGAFLFVFFTLFRTVVSDVVMRTDQEKQKSMFAALFSKFDMIMGMSMVIGMALGGKLTAKHPILPFKYSCCVGALAVVLLQVGFSETKDFNQPRKPVALPNPLKFLSFFTSGDTSLTLAHTANLLQTLVKNTGFELPQIYTAHKFGWEPTDMGKFLVAASLGGVASSVMVPSLQKVLPGLMFVDVTSLAAAMSGMIVARSTSGSGMYAMLGTELLGRSSNVSQNASLTQAEAAKTSPAEVQAKMGNLQAAVRVVAPLLYSQVFTWGVKRNMPGAPYMMNAFISLVALLLYRLSVKTARKKEVTA